MVQNLGQSKVQGNSSKLLEVGEPQFIRIRKREREREDNNLIEVSFEKKEENLL